MPAKSHGGDPSHPEFPHGTHGGYKAGCRCDPCKEAKRVYAREWSREARKDPVKRARMIELTKAYKKTDKGKETDRKCSRDAGARYRKTDHGRARKCHDIHVRRARKLAATTGSLEIIKMIFEQRPSGYHVDHIVPLSRGGEHHEDNLQYLPASENLRKGYSTAFATDKAIRWQDVIEIGTFNDHPGRE